MSIFGLRLKTLRLENSLTQKELADDFNQKHHFNLTDSSISQYENNSRLPEIDTVICFSKYFKVSTDFILGISNTKNNECLSIQVDNKKFIKIPIIDKIKFNDNIVDYANISDYAIVENNTLTNTCFYLRVNDLSMLNARIITNDLVLVKRQSIVSPGDIAVLLLKDSSTTLRRVFKVNELTFFIPENPSFNISYTSEDIKPEGCIEILGKVIQILSNIPEK